MHGSNRIQIVAELWNYLQGDKHMSPAIVPGLETAFC